MLSLDLAADLGELGIARFETRYEDLTQDGHAKLTALAAALGRTCFGQLWAKHPLAGIYRDGIFPILGRLEIEIDPVAARLLGPFEGRGRIQLAHEPGDDSQVNALFLNTYAEVWAAPKRGPKPVGDQAPTLVQLGKVFGEHVFTRPRAPKGQRKVIAFDVPGHPPVPSARYTRPRLADMLAVPASARALDSEFVADDVPWLFGLTHTDGNRHVNSLVYVRLFEDAALRRLAAHGRDLRLLAQSVQIQYRKPCFAGERLICKLQAYSSAHGDGVVGYLGAEHAGPARAHCAIRMQFSAPPGLARDAGELVVGERGGAVQALHGPA